MMEKNIFTALKECVDGRETQIRVSEREWLTPSYIVTLAAYAKQHSVPRESFIFESQNHQGYLNTIGFDSLWGIPCAVERPNAGKKYSVLTLLDNEESTDFANTQITSCISAFTNDDKSEGVAFLKEVIGEVHDNVWSHGKSTGFSMAQIYSNGFIEFALADCGGAFLKELNRVGLNNIQSHEGAIEWCIQKGNSSKKIEDQRDSDWLQQLPSDTIGNPMGSIAKYKKSNNHAGLGLAKLIELIQQYEGILCIASGKAILSISDSKRSIDIRSTTHNWNGVIIMCKLNEKKLKSKASNDADSEISSILDALTD
jgi:hypothetical protein